MATTDTQVNNLVINVLTKDQYDGIASPSPSELYLVTDDVMPVARGGTGATSLANITVGQATADASGNTITTTYATKTELTNLIAANDAMVYKGVIAGTATSPGAYTPAANCGDVYRASASGYVNGQKVEAGDLLICTADSTVAATSSNYATVQET